MPDNDIFPVPLSVDKHKRYDRNSSTLTGSNNVTKNTILSNPQRISRGRGKILNGVRGNLPFRSWQGCSANSGLGKESRCNPISFPNSHFDPTNLTN